MNELKVNRMGGQHYLTFNGLFVLSNSVKFFTIKKGKHNDIGSKASISYIISKLGYRIIDNSNTANNSIVLVEKRH